MRAKALFYEASALDGLDLQISRIQSDFPGQRGVWHPAPLGSLRPHGAKTTELKAALCWPWTIRVSVYHNTLSASEGACWHIPFPDSSGRKENLMSSINYYGQFISSWRWEWFVTLTFADRIPLHLAKERLAQWNRDLCISEGIQAAYIAVFNCTGWTPHCHVLMLGRNKHGKTLQDVSASRWEKRWAGIARVELPSDNLAVSRYLAGNMTPWDTDHYDLVTYNQKLLKKLKYSGDRMHTAGGGINSLRPAAS